MMRLGVFGEQNDNRKDAQGHNAASRPRDDLGLL